MARHVRTASGTKRYGKPIGAVIGGRSYVGPEVSITRGGVRRVAVGLNPESAPTRSERTYGQSQRAQRERVARVHSLDSLARAGKLGFRETQDFKYQSPKALAKARRETGTDFRPKKENLAIHRGRVKGGRDVTFNRLSGKFVATQYHPAVQREERASVSGILLSNRRTGTTGAAARAKARKASVRKPEYVGRRRRES